MGIDAIPLAHGGEGHWYETIVYLIPIVGFGVWLGITYIKDRLRGDSGDETDGSEIDETNRAARRAAARKNGKEKSS